MCDKDVQGIGLKVSLSTSQRTTFHRLKLKSCHSATKFVERCTIANRGTSYETLLKPSKARTMLSQSMPVELTLTVHNLLFLLRMGSQIR